MSKRFFFVCAGVLMLAVAYHLGATNGTAQPSGTIGAAGLAYVGGGNYSVATVDRIVYLDGSPVPAGPVPGTEAIIAVGVGGNASPLVMLADGQVFWAGASLSAWESLGNVLGSPTRAVGVTWGAIKVRYR